MKNDRKERKKLNEYIVDISTLRNFMHLFASVHATNKQSTAHDLLIL